MFETAHSLDKGDTRVTIGGTLNPESQTSTFVVDVVEFLIVSTKVASESQPTELVSFQVYVPEL